MIGQDSRPCNRTEVTWRTSSHSGGQGDCVEVADGVPRTVPVRDSKRQDGDVLTFGHHAWTAFLRQLR